jgi:hypothetical protein
MNKYKIMTFFTIDLFLLIIRFINEYFIGIIALILMYLSNRIAFKLIQSNSMYIILNNRIKKLSMFNNLLVVFVLLMLIKIVYHGIVKI